MMTVFERQSVERTVRALERIARALELANKMKLGELGDDSGLSSLEMMEVDDA